MKKEETKLSLKWIKNLTRACSDRSERIHLDKIHGENYQTWGMSDYIGCWRGKFVAIEFKIYPNIAHKKQIDYLVDIIDSGGIGFIVEFKKLFEITPLSQINLYQFSQEYMTLLKAESSKKELIYTFNY